MMILMIITIILILNTNSIIDITSGRDTTINSGNANDNINHDN